ncbi:rhomboid family intramembrane serine protease [Amphiplicatus metriothermophilus]|uniref:Membrane associated serine protease, rhomboid family n=1 Tax=Amphiplicatus metriothermophilus TaxID=1519374 RepID=A0A239PP63_9PROT|nr:rhomboid family intramembrane serine protease [Amphiplicatus metriothermophilus]MBB5518790.1 membrane associated rhomboid family serine protease [Amphiplicatus metriothermophilus]SNT72055.1 Membrane associated serine protease, rhomboid family [Amphiplicatus metriothermophilus]
MNESGESGSRQAILNAPPVVTALLIALGAAFAALWLAPVAALARVDWLFALSPRRFLDGANGYGGLAGAIVPLATHMFVHANFAHLALNGLWLLAFGAPVAARLRAAVAAGANRPATPWTGAGRFLALFILSGVAGALVYIAAHPRETAILVGASGGVSGLLGALVRFALRPAPRPDAAPALYARLTSRSVLVWSAVIIALNLALGFLAPALGLSRGGIAWEAHIGGYLFALIAFPLFEPRLRAR